MSRLVAFLSNDTGRVRCALQDYQHDLVVPGETRHDGWGIGYYQHGEILFKKRPKTTRESILAVPLLSDLQTDALLFHVREATVGSWTLENTHPFRFRSWLFAHRGTVGAFAELRAELQSRVPEHIRRNLRGETDSIHVFQLFLTRLYETRGLDEVSVDPRLVAGVFARTLSELDALSRKHGAPEPAPGNYAITNGRVLIATRRGLPMHYVRRAGIEECVACAAADEASRGRLPPAGHPLLRYVLVASDLRDPKGPGWAEVPDGSVLTVQRNLDVAIAPLAL